MRFASIGPTYDLYHIIGVDRPFDFINIPITRQIALHPSLENRLQFDTNLRLKVIRPGDDLLYGVEMLTDDDFMIVAGLGNAINVELISTEEILDYVRVVVILLLILR